MSLFRDLKASEIECRIAQIKQNGLSLLLYKDARVDQNILDETIGPYNWTREHEVVNGNLYCTVSLYDQDKKDWVYKQDVGVESYTEKEKGQASDAFKRACFNWGIGRELYTAPFIWIPAGKCNIDTSGGKPKCYDRFYVSKITIKDKVITELEISLNGKVVFTQKGEGKTKQDSEPAETSNKTRITAKKSTIDAMCKRHGLDPVQVCDQNGIDWMDMTEEQTQKMLDSLMAKFGVDA